MRSVLSTVVTVLIALPIVLSSSCSSVPVKAPEYDPNKNYAAFLMVDSESGRATLLSSKQRALGEGYLPGPVEFYKPGTQDFEPVLKKLYVGPQIKLIWTDISPLGFPDIRSKLEKLGYKGQVRLVASAMFPSQ
jgi:hypothetical protein